MEITKLERMKKVGMIDCSQRKLQIDVRCLLGVMKVGIGTEACGFREFEKRLVSETLVLKDFECKVNESV